MGTVTMEPWFLLLLPIVSSLPTTSPSPHHLEDSTDPEFVLKASCTAEGIQKDGVWNVTVVTACTECWDSVGDIISSLEHNLSIQAVTQARLCTHQFLPNIEKVCKAHLQVLETQTQVVSLLHCFYNYVIQMDEGEAVMDMIREDMEEEEDVTAEFIIGTSCAVESQDEEGIFDDKRIEECGQCWETAGDALSEKWVTLAESCVSRYLPNIGAVCHQVLDNLEVGDTQQGRQLFGCFLEYVRERDREGTVQGAVAQYLRDSVDTEFVIGTGCTITAVRQDGTYNETQIKECGLCWERAGDPLSEEGLALAKQCVIRYMPQIGQVCNKELELMSVGNVRQARNTLRCFYDFVIDNDTNGVVQMGVRDYLDNVQ